jgi:hypothetical protein
MSLRGARRRSNLEPMLRFCLKPLVAIVVAAVAIGCLRAAEPDRADPPAADPPAGYLLIASSSIQDPRFYHSVILMVRHDRNGAFGIIINRPVTDESIASLLANSAGASKDAEEEKRSRASCRSSLAGRYSRNWALSCTAPTTEAPTRSTSTALWR